MEKEILKDGDPVVVISGVSIKQAPGDCQQWRDAILFNVRWVEQRAGCKSEPKKQQVHISKYLVNLWGKHGVNQYLRKTYIDKANSK